MLEFKKYYHMSEEEVNELLTIQQRVKLKQAIRRNKAKIQMGAKRARRKIADLDTLRKRSVKQAKNVLIKKFLKNKSKQDLSYAARGALEKKLARPGAKSAIQRLARKLLPQVRQKDRNKLRKPSGGQNAKS
tara:strand:- start:47 stop:442 length:396 start_codon:yes stop_codon:yes gene_type:complete